VLSFPIPLRILFAAHVELLTPLLRIIHRVIARRIALLCRWDAPEFRFCD
jgi:hypothetical protein